MEDLNTTQSEPVSVTSTQRPHIHVTYDEEEALLNIWGWFMAGGSQGLVKIDGMTNSGYYSGGIRQRDISQRDIWFVLVRKFNPDHELSSQCGM